jgi:hypothetical protein
MSAQVDAWRTIRTVEGYQKLPYTLSVQFNPLSSMLRVELSDSQHQHSMDVSPFICEGDIPEKGVAQSLIDGDMALGEEMELSVRNKAFTLIQIMDADVSRSCRPVDLSFYF